ncbi:MAG: acyl-phosphate glycerol 3-phosphate acyltransferase [Verrucomicrobia bacterium 13_1_40CM_4_54_4]|nr:MAG: acyl-phosphate glycerol 3-phosphate acyltransferase [Verrucomicrobia bacterium 13_1_40CM_4_54_4]
MLRFAAVALVSYLLGSIPAGYLVGRIAGIDIRKVGSGNIGATNVTRTLGRRYGYLVFVVDFAKGAVAVCISTEIYGIVGAVFCVLGHVFPIWLKLKGGKGVATSAGVLFGLMPLAALIGGVVWVFTFEVTRYVSVASVTTAVILPVAVLGLMHARHTNGMEMFYFSLCLAAVVVFRHRSNLSRLVHGTEPRFKRK